ncbi:MAG: substrate-binding periplasmic protein [Campylobacterales bacterium]
MMRAIMFFVFLSTILFATSLTIYTEENPPWNYKKDGKLQGVVTEVVKLIQKDIGNSDPIQLVPWTRGYKETLQKPNHILFATSRLPQREELFHWVGPVIVSESYLYKHKSNREKIKTFEDAKKVSLIDAGSVKNAGYMTLKEKGFENLSDLSKDFGSLKRLQSGRVDLVALGNYNFVFKAALSGLDADDFVNTGIKVNENSLYIAISKGTDKAIVQKWQNSFEKIKKSKVIDTLIQKELKKIKHDTKN